MSSTVVPVQSRRLLVHGQSFIQLIVVQQNGLARSEASEAMKIHEACVVGAKGCGNGYLKNINQSHYKKPKSMTRNQYGRVRYAKYQHSPLRIPKHFTPQLVETASPASPFSPEMENDV